jgi:hypothetical protein
VIPAEQKYAGRKFAHEGEKQRDALERKFAAVDVIAQKKVTGGWPEMMEEPDKIMETPVDVADDADGNVHADETRLRSPVLAVTP